MALPGGLALFVVPVLVYFLIPESPRWHLRKGHPQAAVDIVNRIIRRSGDRVPPLTVEALGDPRETPREQLPPYWALFAKGQLRWTTVGVLSGVCAGTAFNLINTLLPKALIEQGALMPAAAFGVATLVYFASIPGKGFTGFLMEIIGRRWTITYALVGSLPGIFLMFMAHRAGQHATVVMVAGGLITGFTVLSSFTAIRMYLSEQFPTALRARGHIFGEFDRPDLCRRAGAVSDDTAHRLADDLLRHDFRGGGDRRLHPVAVRPRDRGPARNRDRKRAGARLRRRRRG